MKEKFQKIFFIILPNEFWLKFPTPSKLVDEVGFVDEALHLNFSDTKNQWDVRNNKKLYWPSKNPIFYIIQFVLNNIPSNIYIYQNFTNSKLGGGSSQAESTE